MKARGPAPGSSIVGVDEYAPADAGAATTGQGKTKPKGWREPRTSAKIKARPSRSGQGFQKARLGLAAEDPVRAGLPRRHITEHRTEMQMIGKFDPIDLDAYAPKGYITFHQLYKHAITTMALSYLGYRGINPLEDREERERKVKTSVEILEANPTHPMWFWASLRDFLISGQLLAFVINDQGLVGVVAKETWSTDYAKTIFSTGKIYDRYVVHVIFTECEKLLEVFSHAADSYAPSEKRRGLSPEELEDYLKLKPSLNRDVFDRDVFYRILICELYTNGLPELKRGCAIAFRQKLIDAYVAEDGPGGAPSMAWVKARVLPIMRRLRNDEEEVNEMPVGEEREADNEHFNKRITIS